mmetsp:Transcript_3447/g.13331  ORF Transcript_3447/g.13331 Transcript_3447/m.13331 type:complete len:201 (+) Transcript_3447:490-1092(+)
MSVHTHSFACFDIKRPSPSPPPKLSSSAHKQRDQSPSRLSTAADEGTQELRQGHATLAARERSSTGWVCKPPELQYHQSLETREMMLGERESSTGVVAPSYGHSESSTVQELYRTSRRCSSIVHFMKHGISLPRARSKQEGKQEGAPLRSPVRPQGRGRKNHTTGGGGGFSWEALEVHTSVVVTQRGPSRRLRRVRPGVA